MNGVEHVSEHLSGGWHDGEAGASMVLMLCEQLLW
jgi:hypothetical protein